MIRAWHYLGLCLGLECIRICWGYPLAPNESLGTTVSSNWSILISIACLVSTVMVLIGCLCCRPNKGFQEFTDEATASGGGATEFTIFPPLPPASVTAGRAEEGAVRFEPLPDIRPRPAGSKQPVAKKPAAFNNALSRGLDASDWFGEDSVDFPRAGISYERELGAGWFGRSVLARTVGPTGAVVVKILHHDACAADRAYFLHEVRAYRDLRHDNVLRLVARCLDADPFLVLLEACPLGNLKSWLLDHRPESHLHPSLTLTMSLDIASGLQHMLEHGFVHTDLAARNCLVADGLRVKVGDYGDTIDAFKEDYYVAGELALAVRWCAPETVFATDTTIQTKQVTPLANVWSYGVTVWELESWGRRPYDHLSDDEVVAQVLVERQAVLPKPESQSPHADHLYRVMTDCWLPVDARPSLPAVIASLSQLTAAPRSPSLDSLSEASFVERISEAIRDLDDALASQQTWSSSAESSPEKQCGGERRSDWPRDREERPDWPREEERPPDWPREEESLSDWPREQLRRSVADLMVLTHIEPDSEPVSMCFDHSEQEAWRRGTVPGSRDLFRSSPVLDGSEQLQKISSQESLASQQDSGDVLEEIVVPSADLSCNQDMQECSLRNKHGSSSPVLEEAIVRNDIIEVEADNVDEESQNSQHHLSTFHNTANEDISPSSTVGRLDNDLNAESAVISELYDSFESDSSSSVNEKCSDLNSYMSENESEEMVNFNYEDKISLSDDGNILTVETFNMPTIPVGVIIAKQCNEVEEKEVLKPAHQCEALHNDVEGKELPSTVERDMVETSEEEFLTKVKEEELEVSLTEDNLQETPGETSGDLPLSVDRFKTEESILNEITANAFIDKNLEDIFNKKDELVSEFVLADESVTDKIYNGTSAKPVVTDTEAIAKTVIENNLANKCSPSEDMSVTSTEDSCVVLGPCDDFSLDFFRGLKTSYRESSDLVSSSENVNDVLVEDLEEQLDSFGPMNACALPTENSVEHEDCDVRQNDASSEERLTNSKEESMDLLRGKNDEEKDNFADLNPCDELSAVCNSLSDDSLEEHGGSNQLIVENALIEPASSSIDFQKNLEEETLALQKSCPNVEISFNNPVVNELEVKLAFNENIDSVNPENRKEEYVNLDVKNDLKTAITTLDGLKDCLENEEEESIDLKKSQIIDDNAVNGFRLDFQIENKPSSVSALECQVESGEFTPDCQASQELASMQKNTSLKPPREEWEVMGNSLLSEPWLVEGQAELEVDEMEAYLQGLGTDLEEDLIHELAAKTILHAPSDKGQDLVQNLEDGNVFMNTLSEENHISVLEAVVSPVNEVLEGAQGRIVQENPVHEANELVDVVEKELDSERPFGVDEEKSVILGVASDEAMKVHDPVDHINKEGVSVCLQQVVIELADKKTEPPAQIVEESVVLAKELEDLGVESDEADVVCGNESAGKQRKDPEMKEGRAMHVAESYRIEEVTFEWNEVELFDNNETLLAYSKVEENVELPDNKQSTIEVEDLRSNELKPNTAEDCVSDRNETDPDEERSSDSGFRDRSNESCDLEEADEGEGWFLHPPQPPPIVPLELGATPLSPIVEETSLEYLSANAGFTLSPRDPTDPAWHRDIQLALQNLAMEREAESMFDEEQFDETKDASEGEEASVLVVSLDSPNSSHTVPESSTPREEDMLLVDTLTDAALIVPGTQPDVRRAFVPQPEEPVARPSCSSRVETLEPHGEAREIVQELRACPINRLDRLLRNTSPVDSDDDDFEAPYHTSQFLNASSSEETSPLHFNKVQNLLLPSPEEKSSRHFPNVALLPSPETEFIHFLPSSSEESSPLHFPTPQLRDASKASPESESMKLLDEVSSSELAERLSQHMKAGETLPSPEDPARDWMQPSSMLAFAGANEMSTKFDDYTQDWESDSGSDSSSSGEFVWQDGDQDVLADIRQSLRPQPRAFMEMIPEEDEDDDEDSSSSGEAEFVPSAWNSMAVPSRSALRSLESSRGALSVRFKRQKYHCVYEYPREEEVCAVPREAATDYASYADWELMEADDLAASQPAEEDEEEEEVVAPRRVDSFDFYKLSTDDFTQGMEDGEFFISSSARPFQSYRATSQFFPGGSDPSDDEEEIDTSDRDVDTGPFDIDINPLIAASDVLDLTSVSNVDIVVDGDIDIRPFDTAVDEAESTGAVASSEEMSSSSSPSVGDVTSKCTGLGELRYARDQLKLDLLSLDEVRKRGRSEDSEEDSGIESGNGAMSLLAAVGNH